MKVILCDNSHYEIFLYPFFPIKEEYLKDLFWKLKMIYHLEVGGFYQVQVHYDQKYGSLLEIEKMEYPIYSNEVELHMIIEECDFFFEVEDPFSLEELLKKGEIISFQNRFYYQMKEPLDIKEISYLMEQCRKVIYKKKKR